MEAKALFPYSEPALEYCAGPDRVVNVPTTTIGWLLAPKKGRQGAMIDGVRHRTGVAIGVEQLDSCHCAVRLSGEEQNENDAYSLVVAEILARAAAHPSGGIDCNSLGTACDKKAVG